MAEPMREEDLVEIEAAASAATPGPWHVYHAVLDQQRYPGRYTIMVDEEDGSAWSVADRQGFWDEDDAEFIAVARTALPSLLAEIRRLQRENRLLHLSRGSSPIVGGD